MKQTFKYLIQGYTAAVWRDLDLYSDSQDRKIPFSTYYL